MGKNNTSPSSYINLLKDYYKSSTTSQLIKSLLYDFISAIFLQAGSGLTTSVLKGLIGHLLIKSTYPLFIGKRTRFINMYNISLGKNVQIKDDVTIIAHGKIYIGDNVVIGEKTTIIAVGNLVIGNNVTITRNCYIAQIGGEIVIEDNVLIGDYSRIHTVNHKYGDRDKSILMQGHERTEIHIGKHVWIGSGVMIINNTTIGEHAIIGANAVVNKNIPSYVVAAGIPAKIIKKLHAK